MRTKYLPRRDRNHSRQKLFASLAFTRVELLVVVAFLIVLGGLLLPALANGTQQAEGFQCLNSLKRLSQAWLMYSRDNGGNLTPNGSESSQPSSPTDPNGQPGGKFAQWCPGRQDPGGNFLAHANLASNAANVGFEWIQAGLIYPYVNNVRDYLCPADKSFNRAGSTIYPHVRSKSMNAWLNEIGGADSVFVGGAEDASLRFFQKESDLSVPGPANTFVFIDENQQSINDSTIVEDPTQPNPAAPAWIDGPASYHNDAAGISFCDGHAGLKRWRDPVVLSMIGMNDTQSWSEGNTKYRPDVLWLVNRTTALKTATAFLGPQGW